jgi:hypothetical protein
MWLLVRSVLKLAAVILAFLFQKNFNYSKTILLASRYQGRCSRPIFNVKFYVY